MFRLRLPPGISIAAILTIYLFKRFYAFSEHFLEHPRFPLNWKMRTCMEFSYLLVSCPQLLGNG